jgi:hypothetical protein
VFKDLEPTQIRDENNQIHTGGKKFLDTLKTFWEKIFTREEYTNNNKKDIKMFEDYIKDNWDKDVNPLFDTDFTIYELRNLIKALPNGKSPGPPGYSYEFIKILFEICPKDILEIYNTILRSGHMPRNWCKGSIILLYKAGDKLDPSNYRPITLMNCHWKIIMKMLDKRITTFLERENFICEEQNGFRKKRSCQDHIAGVQEILARRNKAGEKTFLTLFDLKKAYDSVWHEALWYKMAKAGIRGKTLKIIMNAYSKSTANNKTWFF